MFIGHLALAFAGKKAAPKTPLWLLLLGTSWIDLLWPIFLLAGWETVRIEPGNTELTPLHFTSYPYTHSLLAVLGWGLLLGLAYFALARNRAGAVCLGLLVVSHWVLDWISHVPDLLLLPGGTHAYGLGLWNSIPATMVVEISLFGMGVWIYRKVSTPRNRGGQIALWSFLVFMMVMYVANIFGPPPPSERALAVFALVAWLIPLWGYWIDRTSKLV